MSPGEMITRWTIRLALLLCAASIGMRIQRGKSPARDAPAPSAKWARGLWTLAFLIYLSHLAAAFSFYHAWSHAAAWEHTARRTKETLGVDWGGGVWFNYAFTLAWAVDVVCLWLRPVDPFARWRWIAFAWRAWFALVVFFATVVFETGGTRWLSALVLTLLGVAFFWPPRTASPGDRALDR